jgi:osmoprotectant transport system permease protein
MIGELWSYVQDNGELLTRWTWATVWLATAPLAVGLLLAVPFGWAASRYRWSYNLVVGGAGILYTIPSLVMFVVLPQVLGTRILNPLNVGVALTVYGFALLVRAIADGLSSTPAQVLDAAEAMGMSDRQKLWKVQAPLAVPVVIAGVRVVAVSNVSLISVASIIGTAQLGQLFVAGSNAGSLTPIVLGLVLFIAMAVVLDQMIIGMGAMLAPWRREQSS